MVITLRGAMSPREASVFQVLPYVLGVFELRGTLYVWASNRVRDMAGLGEQAIATLAKPEQVMLTEIDPRPIFPREVKSLWVRDGN